MNPSLVFSSWMAFYFLVFRGVMLGISLLWDLNIPRVVGGGWYQLSGSDRRFDAMVWSPLWGLLAIAIIAPWLREWLSKKGLLFVSIGEEHALRINVVGRWVLTLLILSAAFGILDNSLIEFLTFQPVLLAGLARFFSILVTGLLFVLLPVPEVTTFASAGFTGFIDAVFFPGGREKLPPYTLKLARFYVEKQRWDEAEAEYARMLSFYPDQPEAWQERLALASQRPAPAEPAPAEVLAAGFKALSKPADREALHRRFTELSG